MKPFPVDHPAWWRALTLKERLESEPAHPKWQLRSPLERANTAATTNMSTEDGVTAERRLRQWRRQAPFEDEEVFLRRLTSDNLTLESFFLLLGESDASSQRRSPETPEWLSDLAQAWTSYQPNSVARPLPVVAPLIAQAEERLRRSLDRLENGFSFLPFDRQWAMGQLMPILVARADRWLRRAVVLEMKVASLRGELGGESPAGRFEGFIQRLRGSDAAARFLLEYPVLARLLVESIRAWTQVSIDLLQRLAQDWDSICTLIEPESDPGEVVEIALGLGDLHRQGQSVGILRCRDGSRLVYKPRSLKVEAHFVQLLAWLHRRGAPAFKVPRVLDRGEYGWCEFVEHRPCQNLVRGAQTLPKS
jgi:hypothetical protein